ncbi:MAG: hypothetical protein ABIK92_13080 [Pseudomonadota bacterium]
MKPPEVLRSGFSASGMCQPDTMSQGCSNRSLDAFNNQNKNQLQILNFGRDRRRAPIGKEPHTSFLFRLLLVGRLRCEGDNNVSFFG